MRDPSFKIQDWDWANLRLWSRRKITQQSDLIAFEIGPKFSKTHVFRGTILYPLGLVTFYTAEFRFKIDTAEPMIICSNSNSRLCLYTIISYNRFWSLWMMIPRKVLGVNFYLNLFILQCISALYYPAKYHDLIYCIYLNKAVRYTLANVYLMTS